MASNKFDLSPKLIYASGSTFVFLAILASVFYLQRSTMMDAAYQVFVVICTQDLAIQVNRFGAAATQIFPLLGVQLGLSLPQVLWIYSQAFILYPSLLFLFLILGKAHKPFILALPLLYLLLVSHTFYWMQSELLQANAFVLFLFAFLWKENALNYKTLSLFFCWNWHYHIFSPTSLYPLFFPLAVWIN